MKTCIDLVTNDEYLLQSKRKFLKQSIAVCAISTLPFALTFSKSTNAHPVILGIIVTVFASTLSGVLTYYIVSDSSDYVTIDGQNRRVRIWINQDYCINCGMCERVASSGVRLEVVQEACPTDAVEWSFYE